MPLNEKQRPEMQIKITGQNLFPCSRMVNTQQWQIVVVTMDMKNPEPSNSACLALNNAAAPEK